MQPSPPLFDIRLPKLIAQDGNPATKPIYKVSLVAHPAAGHAFRAQLLGEAIVLEGPILSPGQLISRSDHTGKPYFIRFGRQVIQQIAADFALAPQFSLGHRGALAEATLLQSWILEQDERHGEQTLKVGTWMIRITIPQLGPVQFSPVDQPDYTIPRQVLVSWRNPALGPDALPEILTGFSLEGLFSFRESIHPWRRQIQTLLGNRPALPRRPNQAISIRLNADDSQDDFELGPEDQNQDPDQDQAANELVALSAGLPTQAWTAIWQWLLQALMGKAIEVAATAATKAIQEAFDDDGKKENKPDTPKADDLQHDSTTDAGTLSTVDAEAISYQNGQEKVKESEMQQPAGQTENVEKETAQQSTPAAETEATELVLALKSLMTEQSQQISSLHSKIDQLEQRITVLSASPSPLPSLEATIAKEAKTAEAKAPNAVADTMVKRMRQIKAAKKLID